MAIFVDIGVMCLYNQLQVISDATGQPRAVQMIMMPAPRMVAGIFFILILYLWTIIVNDDNRDHEDEQPRYLQPLTPDEQRRLIDRALGMDRNWFVRLQTEPGWIAVEVLLVVGILGLLLIAGKAEGYQMVLDSLTDLAPWGAGE